MTLKMVIQNRIKILKELRGKAVGSAYFAVAAAFAVTLWLQFSSDGGFTRIADRPELAMIMIIALLGVAIAEGGRSVLGGMISLAEIELFKCDPDAEWVH